MSLQYQDSERASKIAKLVRELNEELKSAQQAGLRVEIFNEEIQQLDSRWPRHKLQAVVTKVVEIE